MSTDTVISMADFLKTKEVLEGNESSSLVIDNKDEAHAFAAAMVILFEMIEPELHSELTNKQAAMLGMTVLNMVYRLTEIGGIEFTEDEFGYDPDLLKSIVDQIVTQCNEIGEDE